MPTSSLTDRQIQILKAVVEEHIQSGEPVGSDTLDKKYNLGVSPATIRNEMVQLTEQGFLLQPFTSAGRTPTPTALKYYIRQLMEEKEMTVADEVAVKEKIWDYRFNKERLLRELTRSVAQKTKAIAVATTSWGDVYHAGYANILDIPEFFDIDVTKTVLSIIDDLQQMEAIFGKAVNEDPIHVLLGDDLEVEYLKPCGMVFTSFGVEDKVWGHLGVIGPSRLDYPWVMPMMRWIHQLVNEISQNWS